jgi:hypothetical protein
LNAVVDTDNGEIEVVREVQAKKRKRNCQRIWHFSGGVRKAKSKIKMDYQLVIN